MMTAPGKVLIVDDEEGVRVALRRLLVAAGFDVQTFASAAALLERTIDEAPACVLLDQQMPGLSGLEAQRSIARESNVSIVFLTGHADVPTSVEAMKGGAVDFLTKPVDEQQLLDAVTRALTRSRLLVEQLRERQSFLERLAQLTPRERQVGAHVIQGLLNKQIAGKLGTAEKTVKVHRARMMEKLAVSSVAELARLAERTQTLRPEDAPLESIDTGAPGSRGASE